MDKKLFLVTCFLLFASWASSQSIFEDNTFFPSGGISIQKHIFGEAEVCYGSGDATCGSCGSDDVFFPKLGSEFTIDNSKLVLGPKFSCEYVYAFLGTRINIIDYTNFTKHDWRFTPEIGLSFCAIISIYYGYNIPLTEDRLSSVTTNRITLTFTLCGL